MKIRRTFDATFLNSVVNHSDVRPWLGNVAAGEIDLSGVIGNSANYALVTERGGWLVVNIDAGLYEVHSQFSPEGRGDIVAPMRDAIHFMFTATDCVELVTRCPDDNKAALGLARTAGFREVFRRDACWHGVDGLTGCSFQSLRLERWREIDMRLLELGEKFHSQLEAAKLESGSSLDVHPHDPAHDRAVGAAFAMVMACNPHKGLFTYNRWAKFAGYAPITMVNEHPPTFDIWDAVVALRGQEMEVLQCR